MGLTSRDEGAAMQSSFDNVARGLAEGSISRRKALGLMGAALFGGALASIPGVAWAAKPSCPSGVRCGRNCCPDATFVCSRGKCACPTGTTQCGGTCVDLLTDEANCDICGNACAVGASCVNGQCQCPTGQEVCPGNNTCVSSCSTTSGEVLNPETCQCECLTGTTLCPGNNTCVQNCPEGETLNTTTCTCESSGCVPEGQPCTLATDCCGDTSVCGTTLESPTQPICFDCSSIGREACPEAGGGSGVCCATELGIVCCPHPNPAHTTCCDLTNGFVCDPTQGCIQAA